MDEKQLKFLYDNYATGKGFKDYNEFKSLMVNDDSRRIFFDASNKDLGFKDFTEFDNTLGLKKKESVPFQSLDTKSQSPFLQTPVPEWKPTDQTKKTSQDIFKSFDYILKEKSRASKEVEALSESFAKGGAVGDIVTIPTSAIIEEDVNNLEKAKQNLSFYEKESIEQGKTAIPLIQTGIKNLAGTFTSKINGTIDYGKMTNIANKLSAKLGGGEYVKEVIYNQLVNQEKAKKLEPGVIKNVNSILKKEKNVGSVEEYTAGLDKLFLDKKVSIEQQIGRGGVLAQTEYKQEEKKALEKYKPALEQAYNAGNQDEINAITEQYYNDLKGIQRKINGRLSRTRQELVTQFNTEISKYQNISEDSKKYLNDVFNRAYKKAVENDLEVKKEMQNAQYNLLGFQGILGKSFLNGFFGTVSNYGSGLVGVGMGGDLSDYLRSLQSKVDEFETVDLEVKGKNIFNPQTYAVMVGKQLGYMAPTLVGAAVTKNPFLGGTAGFLGEQFANAGDVYNQTMTETGDPVKSQQATNRYLVRNIPTIPLYFLEADLLMKATGLKKGSKLLSFGIESAVVEPLQELPSSFFQQAESVNAKPLKKWLIEDAPEIYGQTVISSAATTGFLSGLGKLAESIKTQEQQQSLQKNYFYNLLNTKGQNAAFSVLEIMAANGGITNEQLMLNKENLAKVKTTIQELKQIGLTDVQVEGYLALLAERDTIRENMTKTSNPDIVTALEKKLQEKNKQLEEATSGKVKATTVQFSTGSKITIVGEEPSSVMNRIKEQLGTEVTIQSTDEKVNEEANEIVAAVPQQENTELQDNLINTFSELYEAGINTVEENGTLIFYDEEGNRLNVNNFPEQVKAKAIELQNTFAKMNGNNVVESIEVNELARQYAPVTDEMVVIEKEFAAQGYKIDTDYDNEVAVFDSKGNLLEPEDLPEGLRFLASRYELATQMLGDLDDSAREIALQASRGKTEDVEAEIVALPEAPKQEQKAPINAAKQGELSLGIEPKPKENAVQKPSTESVLQRKPGEVREAGGQRQRVEPIVERQKSPEEIERDERQEADIALKLKGGRIFGELLNELGRLVPKRYWNPKEKWYNTVAKAYVASVRENKNPQLVKKVNKLLGIKVPRSKAKIQASNANKDVIVKARKIDQVDNPRDRVLAYFVGGGRISFSAIDKLFGGKDKRIRWKTSVGKEKKAKIGILAKYFGRKVKIIPNAEGIRQKVVTSPGRLAPTIDELAHDLWESYGMGENDNFDTQDYREAIEQVLLDHNSATSMAKELNEKYYEAVKSEMSKEDMDMLEDEEIAQILNAVEGLDEDVREELIDIIESYSTRTADGSPYIDWDRMEKDSNGFEPKLLELSEKASNQIYEILKSPKQFANRKFTPETLKQEKSKIEERKEQKRQQRLKENENKKPPEEPPTNLIDIDFQAGKTTPKTTLTKERFSKLIDRIKKAFPKVNIITSAKEFADKLKQYGIDAANLQALSSVEETAKALEGVDVELLGKKEQKSEVNFMRTPSGTIYGAQFPDGTIYINQEVINAETPIHELSHIWESMFPNEWKKGIELMRNSKGFKQALSEIQNNPFYADKTLQQQESEALNTLIGRKGEGYFQNEMLSKFKAWLRNLFIKIGEALNIKISPDTKLNQFTDKVIGEILSGKEIKGELKGKEVKLSTEEEKPYINLPEGLEIVDGWYSPIEKRLLETKIEKQSANKWLTIVGSKDEAIYTGVKGWLESKNPQEQVSKQEILDWMKDNRVEIVEVVKEENENSYSKHINKLKKIGDRYNLELEFDNEGLLDITDKENGEIYRKTDVSSYRDVNFLVEENFMSREKALAIKEIFELDDAYDSSNVTDQVKFNQYQLEGEKENYKEVLVTLPKSEPFKSPHFDEANILVHLRMNTRIDSEGNKVLFLEEIQSDWGQKGKKEGFSKPANLPLIKKLNQDKQEVLNSSKSYQILNNKTEGDLSVEVFNAIQQKATNMIDNPFSTDESRKERFLEEIGDTLSYWDIWENVPKMNQDELSEFYDIYIKELKNNDVKIPITRGYRLASVENKIEAIDKDIFNAEEEKGIPTAPFVTDTNAWTKLGLKIAITQAIKEGATKLAWTTGEQQNERYDLSKQVDKLEWVYDKTLSKPTGTLYGYKNGKMIMEEVMPESKLEDYVGKGVAENLLSASENDSPKYKGYSQKTLTGDEIKVGGKGMKGFYDNIVPSIAKSLVKELTGQNVEVGETKIETQKQDVKLSNTEFDISEAPQEIKDLIDKYEEGLQEGNYTELYKFSQEAKQLGYEVDYDLSGDITSFKRVSGKLQLSTQQSIDITPELKRQVKAGIPKFMASANQNTQAINDFDKLNKKSINEMNDFAKKYGAKKLKQLTDITSNFGTYISNLEKSNYIIDKKC